MTQNSKVLEVFDNQVGLIIIDHRIVVSETHGMTVDRIKLQFEVRGWESPQRLCYPIEHHGNGCTKRRVFKWFQGARTLGYSVYHGDD